MYARLCSCTHDSDILFILFLSFTNRRSLAVEIRIILTSRKSYTSDAILDPVLKYINKINVYTLSFYSLVRRCVSLMHCLE